MQIFKIWLKGMFLILFIIVCPFGINNNVTENICQSKTTSNYIQEKTKDITYEQNNDDEVIDDKENFDYEPSPFIQREIKQQTVKPITVTNTRPEINYEKAEKQRLKRLKQAEKQIAKMEKKEAKQTKKAEKQALKEERRQEKAAAKEEKKLAKELKKQEKRKQKNKDDD